MAAPSHVPSLLDLFAPQVEAVASNLNTNDVFVLKSPKALFVWRGVGASDEEMAATKPVAGFLGGSPAQVSEGKEPGEYLNSDISQKKREFLQQQPGIE